jgi:hypothetical protein
VATPLLQDKVDTRYWAGWLVKLQSKLLGLKPSQGAVPLLYCGSSPELQGGRGAERRALRLAQ